MLEKVKSILVAVLFIGAVAYLMLTGLAPSGKQRVSVTKGNRFEIEERRAELLSSAVSSRASGPEPESYKNLGEWGLRGRKLFQVLFDDNRLKVLTNEDLDHVKKRFAFALPESAEMRTNEVRDRLGILRFLSMCFAHGKMPDDRLYPWFDFLISTAANEGQTWAVQRRAVVAMNSMPLSVAQEKRSLAAAKLPQKILDLVQVNEEELVRSPRAVERVPAAENSTH